ncbi:MAG: hypothetical protein ING29_12905 [Azospirillum sp.]|nr:hypothetical protein [Azospirillum sp.]
MSTFLIVFGGALAIVAALLLVVRSRTQPLNPTPVHQPVLNASHIEKVVTLFQQQLDDGLWKRGPSPEGHVFDAKVLPYPKAWVEQALLRQIAQAADDGDRSYYRTALRCLASFQDGVGQEPIRLPPDSGVSPEPDRWPSDEVRARAYELGTRVEAERQRAMNAK